LKRLTPLGLIVGSLLIWFIRMELATGDAPLPALQRSGTVEYLIAGMGKDTVQAMQSQASDWPLQMEFAEMAGQRSKDAAQVAVQIRDADGHIALGQVRGGPLLLVRLSPGLYRIDAMLGGSTLHRDVRIQPGRPSSVRFLWPQGAGDAETQAPSQFPGDTRDAP
jgi:hypothetical protein